MLTQNDIARITDADVFDNDGDKIGSVGQVYLDDQGGNPEWVTVKTGLFGTKETFIPLQGAQVSGDQVTVAYDKGRVKDAPNVDADGELSSAEENELYTYYGLAPAGQRVADVDTDRSYQDTAAASGSGRRDSGFSSIGDDDAMTRSEERLVAGTRTEETGKARLRKYVVTEQQDVSVPVSREEARLEREPITDANRGDAYDGAEISEAEHEVTLRAERPVVDTETVAVERIRLGKETVQDTETVSGQVRKEQVEFDGVDDRDRR